VYGMGGWNALLDLMMIGAESVRKMMFFILSCA